MFKNTTKGSLETSQGHEAEHLFWLVSDGSISTENQIVNTQLMGGWVQFFFHLSGMEQLEMKFQEIRYQIPLDSGEYFFLYHPSGKLDLEVVIPPGSRMVAVYIDVNYLHQLMVNGSEELSFLKNGHENEKYYIKKVITPSLSIALHQMYDQEKSPNALELFRKAKVYEVLSICLNKGKEPDAESCPFLKDKSNVDKIREARQVLIADLSRNITLKALCREIGISEYNMKIGFKNLYGKPVMAYLNDYKMEVSRHMLEEGRMKVNEVADRLGYRSTSHFIETFKKRFGQTPKQYASK